MTEQRRTRLSATQRAEIWRRWKAGQSLHEIGRAFGKPRTSVVRVTILNLYRLSRHDYFEPDTFKIVCGGCPKEHTLRRMNRIALGEPG